MSGAERGGAGRGGAGGGGWERGYCSVVWAGVSVCLLSSVCPCALGRQVPSELFRPRQLLYGVLSVLQWVVRHGLLQR